MNNCMRKVHYYVPVVDDIGYHGQPACNCGWSYSTFFAFKRNAYSRYLNVHRGKAKEAADYEAELVFSDEMFLDDKPSL